MANSFPGITLVVREYPRTTPGVFAAMNSSAAEDTPSSFSTSSPFKRLCTGLRKEAVSNASSLRHPARFVIERCLDINERKAAGKHQRLPATRAVPSARTMSSTKISNWSWILRRIVQFETQERTWHQPFASSLILGVSASSDGNGSRGAREFSLDREDT